MFEAPTTVIDYREGTEVEPEPARGLLVRRENWGQPRLRGWSYPQRRERDLLCPRKS